MMTTEQPTGKKQPRDPDCFEQWLCERLRERPDRQDEVGRVARWVLRENREGRWAPGTILLARHGHAYDVPGHYERLVRDVANQSEESIETFFRVYDMYLQDESAAYDRMVEERGRDLCDELKEEHSGGDRKNSDGDGISMGAEGADGEPEKPYSWESWNRFFNRALGPEQIGYEVDEDGWPIGGEPRDEERQ